MALALRPRKPLLLVGIALALIALLAGLFAVNSALSARASGRTRYVGLTAGNNTGCGSPGYTSVQAAVDAANTEDTVYLCGANTYTGQVIITKKLTLTGSTGATIAAPNPFPATALSRLPAQFTTDNLFVPQAIVIVWGASATVTISNLSIAGPLPGNSSCADDEYGVLVIAGATATLTNDKVLNSADSNTALAGCQFGVGIQVGREYWPTADFSNFLVEDFVGHAHISGTTISGYQKNGITVDGPGSSAELSQNSITGAGRDAIYGPIIGQNGIQISRGASGKVGYNTVTDNSYTGPAFASSTGILIFGGCGDPLVTGVQVIGNTLTNNDVGISLVNYTPDCANPAATPTNDSATSNHISNNAVTNVGSGSCCGFPYNGYQAGIQDVGNGDVITGNHISGAGYAAQTTVGGPFVLPIDTTSFPTINPTLRENTVM